MGSGLRTSFAILSFQNTCCTAVCPVKTSKPAKERKEKGWQNTKDFLDTVEFLESHKFAGVNSPKVSCFGFLALFRCSDGRCYNMS